MILRDAARPCVRRLEIVGQKNHREDARRGLAEARPRGGRMTPGINYAGSYTPSLTVGLPPQAALSDDRRLVRAEALAEPQHLADAARERAENLFHVARARVAAVAFDVDAQRRARRARPRQTQHRARAVFEKDAHALPRGRAVVHRVCVAELVGALDHASRQRSPG